MKIKVLDHGYIEEIESWGSDERIIEAARMSTDKGFLGWGFLVCKKCGYVSGTIPHPKYCTYGGDPDGKYEHHFDKKEGDEKLLKYLWDNKHCYDSKTEVLVRGKGFVLWEEIKPTDCLGQWDRDSDSLVYEVPISLIKYNHCGKMYRVNHGGVDLLVTENHNMLVRTPNRHSSEKYESWTPEWRLIKCSDLDNRNGVRYRKHASRKKESSFTGIGFPRVDNPMELLRLIGFFIGDGCAIGSRKNGIEFNLKKKRKINYLREVCLGVGWELAELHSFVVRAESISIIFRDLFYDKNGEKRIPEEFLDMNEEESRAILDGLRNSDGTSKRSTWEYSTKSKQVAESIQVLALHAGMVAHITGGKDGSCFRILFLSRMTEPIINNGNVNTSWEDYSGLVYSAHTRTGVLIVRRNGKIVLSGNSTPFEMGGMIVEVMAPIMVYREWHRHRTQSFNEMSGRYIALPDVNYVPDVERLMINSKTNKQAGTIKGADELTEENAEWFRGELDLMWKQQEDLYQKALQKGVPKELARVHIGVGRYSRMRASANLLNWLKFLILRMDSKAQWEIRQYANHLHDLLAVKFPRTMKLFDEGRNK